MVVLTHGKNIAQGLPQDVMRNRAVIEAYLGTADAEVRELRASYGGAPALSGVALDVAPGELAVIVGPNGAGKTTLINALAGCIASTRAACAWMAATWCGSRGTAFARQASRWCRRAGGSSAA